MTTLALHRIWKRLAWPLGLTGLFVGLCAHTWRRWPDLLVDFGRELYVPWQLTEGAVLYRDIAYFNGPLSPYFNATLFQLFGTSLLTLVVVNLAIVVLLCVLFYRLILPRYGPLAASLVCAVFLGGFALAHLRIMGNYNFVCPYSHEMTHGIALSILALALLTTGNRLLGQKTFAVAGLLWGLVFLGKPEIFLALSGALAVLLGARFVDPSVTRKQACQAGLQLLLAGAAPVLLMAAYLATQMPVSEALLSVAGGWRWLLASEVGNQTFYDKVAGLDAPWWNIGRMVLATISVSSVIAATVLLDRWKVRHELRDILLAGFLFTCVVASGQPLLLNDRSLLIVTLIVCLGFGLRFVRHGWGTSEAAGRAAPLAWATFALLMLMKLLLAPKFHHYGFGLAMPATLLAVLIAVAWLPKACCRSWQGGQWCRMALVAICIFDLGSLIHTSSMNVALKNLWVGEGRDQIGVRASMTRDATLAETIEFIATQLPSGATLAALPEGIMLNYQARRVNPTGFINFMPPEIEMYGEREIVGAFRARPPDYVLLVHKQTTEYGVGFFGSKGYGDQIMRWVQDHYVPLHTLGAEPLRDTKFGVKILQRKEPAG